MAEKEGKAIGLAFWYWLLMFVWVVTGWWWGSSYDPVNRGRLGAWGLVVFLLFLLLGLHAFGSPIRGG